jgi:hypothetical protein
MPDQPDATQLTNGQGGAAHTFGRGPPQVGAPRGSPEPLHQNNVILEQRASI